MVPCGRGVTLKAPSPAGFRYQTGVPCASNTVAYVALSPALGTKLPVRYQPGGGLPGLLTDSKGKSWGRHRIQYSVRPRASSLSSRSELGTAEAFSGAW